MPVLGIETSCDETAVALVGHGRLVAERLASQVDIHALFGGVVPEIASREHLRLLPALHEELMAATGVSMADIEAVAVARGPGLLGCLLVGLNFAKGLALALSRPLIGVNHLSAHLLAGGLVGPLTFPALGLLISGGHTHLYHMRADNDLTLLGRTLDDAVGEALDKAAKLVNLPYPGGRFVDLLAAEAEPGPELFPLPYVDNRNLDFSFSGLKTAVATYVAAHPELRLRHMPLPGQAPDLESLEFEPGQRRRLARVMSALNQVVARVLVIKTRRALERVGPIKALVVAGGVAANSHVRRAVAELATERGLTLHLPPPELCTDNAAMIAYAGERLLARGLVHDLALEAIPRGRRVPDDYLPQAGGRPAAP